MLAAALAAAVVAAHPALPLRACLAQGVSARCGTLTVPENRSRPDGREINLHVVVIPSQSKPARPNAFTFLAGGPGGAAASEMPAAAVSMWWLLHQRHDIVLVDQRGTGASNPIVCKPPRAWLKTDTQRRAYVQGCIRSLRVDPRQYGSVQAADDLEAVRVALGYRSFDVYGTSYGATLAQVFLNRHPHSVRTMVLDGATFVDVPFYSRFAVGAQRALGLVATRCAATPACAHAFGDWRTRFEALVARWNERPARLGKSTMSGDGLAGAVQLMLTAAGNAASIPLVVSRAAAGDLKPLSHFVGSSDITTSLMVWSVLCNEPWVGLSSRGPWGTAFDGLTRATLAQMRTVCAFIPKQVTPAASFHRPHSAIPLLVLAGDADPQDPIGNLPGLKQALPNSRVVIAPGQGHSVGQYGCLSRLVGQFVARGTARTLDARCVRDIPLPLFDLGRR